ncbi:hypothetical protein BH09PSE3_BH09PSE3_12420 [soil metagenome]
MTLVQAGADIQDRVLATLIEGLEIEFGRGPGAGLAQQFLEAEDVDFRWEARVEERWLGSYESLEDSEILLDRVAICGRLDGDWFMATMIVDGDGEAHGMLGCRSFGTAKAAQAALVTAH